MSSFQDYTELHNPKHDMRVQKDFENTIISAIPSWSKDSLAEAWAVGEWPGGRLPSSGELWDDKAEAGPVMNMTEYYGPGYEVEERGPTMYNVGEGWDHPPINGECS